MPTTSNNARIHQAFDTARYVIEAPGSDIVLHIGQASTAARALLIALETNCAALITAYNPGGCVVSNAINQAAQKALKRDIETLGLTYMQGYNSAEDGGPPIEPTVVLFRPSQAQADTLAQRYGQLAYVSLSQEGLPVLRWL